jgi:hypothetical protein
MFFESTGTEGHRHPNYRGRPLDPAVPLIADKPYTLSLTSAVKERLRWWSSGRAELELPDRPSRAATTTPASGATGVEVGTATTRTALKATFSLPGVSGTTLTLKQGTTAVTAAATYDATTRVATLTPAAALTADKTYTLASAIKDVAGNPITTETWTFITGPRPTATAKTPASSATGGARTRNITAAFSEAVSGILGFPSSVETSPLRR